MSTLCVTCCGLMPFIICLFVQTLTNAVLLLLYVILTQTAPILVDLITALARQDLQAMEKLAKVNKIIKLI